MNFDQFMGQLQNRLELPSTGETVRATRAVLTTLGERLQAGEASDLAAPLPMEVDRYLTTAESGQRFDFEEFVNRVADRGSVDRPDAVYQAKVVMGLMAEVVPAGEIEQVDAQLPAEYDQLFELVDRDESAAEPGTAGG